MKSKFTLIAIALLSYSASAIQVNEAPERSNTTSSVSELLKLEASSLQRTINDKVYERVKGLQEVNKLFDKNLISLQSTSKEDPKNKDETQIQLETKNKEQTEIKEEVKKNDTSPVTIVNVTSSSFQSSIFENGTLKSSSSTSSVCFNGKCTIKYCVGDKCTTTNKTNEAEFKKTFERIEDHVAKKEQKFNDAVDEHTNKVVNELQKDQSKMHEWIGQLQPKLVQVPLAQKGMLKQDASETVIAKSDEASTSQIKDDASSSSIKVEALP